MSANPTQRPRSAIGPFFVHIAGLPNDYDWKNLKDLLRSMDATHGIWAEMAILSYGRSSGEGYARITRKDEAARVYKHLVERRYSVHLWDIGLSEPVFRGCNCRCPHEASRRSIAEVVRLNRDPSSWMSVTPPQVLSQPMPMDPRNFNRQFAQQSMNYSTQTSPVELAQYVQQMQIQQQRQTQVAYQQPTMTTQMVPNTASYAPPVVVPSSRSSIPINVSQGYARTESRGVFVSNLDYKVTERDIKAYFARAGGKIVECKLKKHSANNKSKGVATIQFETVKQAADAITKFHDTRWHDRKLVVRFDTDATTTEAPTRSARAQQPIDSKGPPLIVDGSRV